MTKSKLYQRYDIIQARSAEELVRLVNIKTKQGWECQGGVSQGNVLEKDYPFCQAIVRAAETTSTTYKKPRARTINQDVRVI